MHRYIIFAVLLSSLCQGAEVIPPPESLAAVRDLVAQSVEQDMSPSVAVAVIQAGEVVWLEAFGQASLAPGTPATPDTPYPLTSCTKPLTALAFMQLRERGLLDLDKPANTYLGENTLRTVDGDASGITPRRLLNHTAGFARFFSHYYPPTTAGAVQNMLARYGVAVIAPGSAFEYSNLGFTAAGAVLEKAADAPWGRFIEENIFGPLGLAHSATTPPPDAATLYTRDSADRYRAIPPVSTDHPAGSAAWMSIGDAARFLQLVLNEGTLEGKTLLKPESVHEMLSAPKSTPQAGLGWFLGDYLSQKSFSHAGGLPGTVAEMRGFPKDKNGIVVLSNSDGHSLTGQIIWAIAGALYAGATEPDEAGMEAPTSQIDDFQGDWAATLEHFSGPVLLTLLIEDDDTAYLRFGEGPLRRLQNFGLLGDEVSGHLWADFPARDDYFGPVKAALALRKAGDVLSGTFTTTADGLFSLATPVRFISAPLSPQSNEADQ